MTVLLAMESSNLISASNNLLMPDIVLYYKCPLCQETFSTMECFNIHAQNKHLKNNTDVVNENLTQSDDTSIKAKIEKQSQSVQAHSINQLPHQEDITNTVHVGGDNACYEQEEPVVQDDDDMPSPNNDDNQFPSVFEDGKTAQGYGSQIYSSLANAQSLDHGYSSMNPGVLKRKLPEFTGDFPPCSPELGVQSNDERHLCKAETKVPAVIKQISAKSVKPNKKLAHETLTMSSQSPKTQKRISSTVTSQLVKSKKNTSLKMTKLKMMLEKNMEDLGDPSNIDDLSSRITAQENMKMHSDFLVQKEPEELGNFDNNIDKIVSPRLTAEESKTLDCSGLLVKKEPEECRDFEYTDKNVSPRLRAAESKTNGDDVLVKKEPEDLGDPSTIQKVKRNKMRKKKETPRSVKARTCCWCERQFPNVEACLEHYSNDHYCEVLLPSMFSNSVSERKDCVKNDVAACVTNQSGNNSDIPVTKTEIHLDALSTITDISQGNLNCESIECLYCKQQVKCKSFLQHVNLRHFWQKRSKQESVEVICNICGIILRWARNLAAHIKSVHEGVKRPSTWLHGGRRTLICDLCGFTTKEKRRLTAHQLMHKGTMMYSCAHCDYKTWQRTSIRDHSYKHSKKKKVPTATLR